MTEFMKLVGRRKPKVTSHKEGEAPKNTKEETPSIRSLKRETTTSSEEKGRSLPFVSFLPS